MTCRSPWSLIVLAAVGIGVLALLWMLAVPSRTGLAERSLSAFESGPHGLRALYLLGRRMNLNVALGTTSVSLLTGAGTIVIGPEELLAGVPFLPEFDESTVWKLLDRGIDVLYLAPIDELPQPDEKESNAPTDDEETPPAATGDEVDTAGTRVSYELNEDGSARFHVGPADSAFFSDAETLEVASIDLEQDSRWKLWERLEGRAQKVFWLGDTGKPLLTVYQGARGKLVALFASEILTNDNIGRADNVVLAYNLLRELDSPLGTYFLESIHGYHRASVGFTNLLVFTTWGRLVILAAIAVFLALMPQVFPLGRLRSGHRQLWPSPVERVRAQARLWQRGGMFAPALRFAVNCALRGEADARDSVPGFGRLLAASKAPRERVRELEEVVSGRRKPDAAARRELIRAYGLALRQRGHRQPYI